MSGRAYSLNYADSDVAARRQRSHARAAEDLESLFIGAGVIGSEVKAITDFEQKYATVFTRDYRDFLIAKQAAERIGWTLTRSL